MPSNFISPFNVKEIFLSYLLGSQQLFVFAFMIIISFICAKFNMPNKMFLLILSVSSLIFGAWLGQAVYILVIFLVGLISFKSIARLFS